jgi:hypothetical protein
MCCEHKIILVEENDKAVGTRRQVVLGTSSNLWSVPSYYYALATIVEGNGLYGE